MVAKRPFWGPLYLGHFWDTPWVLWSLDTFRLDVGHPRRAMVAKRPFWGPWTLLDWTWDTLAEAKFQRSLYYTHPWVHPNDGNNCVINNCCLRVDAKNSRTWDGNNCVINNCLLSHSHWGRGMETIVSSTIVYSLGIGDGTLKKLICPDYTRGLLYLPTPP